MGSKQKQTDSENFKVILGKLLEKADLAIRPVISVFDSVQTRSAVVKRLDQFTVPLLESCAEFLGIALANQDGFKIFAKPALTQRIYLGFSALLPAHCKECGEKYAIDHKPQDLPLFSCFRCFRGSHDCERNRVLKQTLSTMNTPSGFVWLCDKCFDEVDPIELRKQRSRHDSGLLSTDSVSIESNVDFSKLSGNSLLTSTQVPVNSDSSTVSISPSIQTLPTHSPPGNICRNFLNWKCPHGISGKKEIKGKICPFVHPRVCNQFRISGLKGRKGCKKGSNCSFFHPEICKVALDSGLCSKRDCGEFHPRSNRKKKNESHQEKNAPQKIKKKVKQKTAQLNSNDNSKSGDFLELRNLIAGMATKLETLEKKMSQSTPACHPATQPMTIPQTTAPAMFATPVPQSLMPLGVHRLPPHPMTYSHHSFY